MKIVSVLLSSFLLLIPCAWAANQEAAITLAEASRFAGVGEGAQQRLLKAGIDVQQFALGIEEAYRTKPDEQHLQAIRETVSVFPVPEKNKKTVIPSQTLQQASFNLGILLGVDLQEQLKIIDVPAFTAGFKSGYTKTMSSPQLAAASIVVSNYMQQERMKNADEQLKKSLAFLAENAKRKGVIVTPSGLQYEILQEANGPKPTLMDMVTVNYRHTKPDSDFMYDSAEHGHSETMPMRGSIPAGWHELFLLMSKGARYRVYLSPALGFGAEGNGSALLPNEVLITEFTVLDIIPPPAVAY